MTAPAITPAPSAESAPSAAAAAPAIVTPDTSTGGGTAVPPSGESLESSLSAIFGDHSESTAANVGLPASKPADEVPGATETPKADAAATPAADATAAPVADPAAAPADPLAGTQPFTYGEGRTLEGVYRVPGEGLLVPEDKVHVIQNLAEQRDALDRSSREFSDAVQQYETLTQWAVPGPNGQEQIVRGPEATVAMRVQIGRQAVELEALRAVMKDPQKLLGLITQTADNKFAIDPSALETLQLRIDLASREAEDAIAGHLQQYMTPSRGDRGAPAARGAEAPAGGRPNVAAAAPKIIEGAGKQLGVDTKTLTDKDREFLTGQLERYMRTVTEADRRFNPALKLGAPIVDADFAQIVKDRVETRAEIARTAAANARAGADNQARIAAAGAAPPKPAAAAPVVAAPPVQESDDDARWNLMERAAAGGRRA